MNPEESCQAQQEEAVRLLDKLNHLDTDRVNQLIRDVEGLQADMREVKLVIEPLKNIIKHRMKVVYAFALLGVTGADLDTIKAILNLFVPTG